MVHFGVGRGLHYFVTCMPWDWLNSLKRVICNWHEGLIGRIAVHAPQQGSEICSGLSSPRVPADDINRPAQQHTAQPSSRAVHELRLHSMDVFNDLMA